MNNIPRVVIALLVISGVLTIALGEPLYRSGRWGLNGDETMIWLAIIAAVGFFLFRTKYGQLVNMSSLNGAQKTVLFIFIVYLNVMWTNAYSNLGRSGWRSFDYHEVTLFMVANLLAGLIIYYKKDTK